MFTYVSYNNISVKVFHLSNSVGGISRTDLFPENMKTCERLFAHFKSYIGANFSKLCIHVTFM